MLALRNLLPSWLNDDRLAMVLMVLGSCSFAGGFIFVNQHKFNPITTGLTRGISVLFICLLLARKLGQSLSFSSYNQKWLLIRNSIMVVQGLVYAGVQFYLPLPIAMTLNSISPIFVSIYDYWMYGITLSPKQLTFLALSICGVALTANGSYLITFIDQDFTYDGSKFKHYLTQDPVVMLQAGVITVFTMMCHSYGVVITKKLVGITSIQINFVQGLLILLTSAIMYPNAKSNEVYTDPSFSMFLQSFLFSGLLMAIGQLSYIGALTLTKNLGVLTTLSFSSIIMGYLISIFRYNEPINPICTIGTIAIAAGIILIVLNKQIPPQQPPK